MGVHDVKEYVRYHQAKLREQQARSTPAPAPSSVPKKRGGVNEVRSKAEFDQYINDNTDKLIVVDFFATWCGPCKVIAPKLVEHSNSPQYEDKTVFLKVDVDNVPELAQEYGVRAMPTIKFIKNRNEVETVVGANPKAIQNTIEKHI